MFDKISKFMDYVAAITTVTPVVIADVQKLIDDVKSTHLFGANSIPDTDALVATMIAGNDKVQDAPRFLVNDLAKKVSQAVTDVVSENSSFATAILSKMR